ncbi:hypothetical protein WMF39_48260 [Sorangium sp. So ce1504]|uniref:hypothetical protein n=1 Tax=Sorangium sp. So ce1504 TaxID=3133337 RepID=UPI003F61ADA9
MRPSPPASPSRLREYLAILAGALAAGACGALFDLGVLVGVFLKGRPALRRAPGP